MTNRLARSLLLPLAVLATLLVGAATAVASPGTAAAQQSDDGAPAPLNAPTVPKYFPGIGGGPYSIALQAAYATAYGAAANEGYPAATCRLSAGPVAHQNNQTYFQVMLEICCTPPAGAGPARSSVSTPAGASTSAAAPPARGLPYSSTTATARTRSDGASTPTARSAPWATAWTCIAPTPRTTPTSA